MLKSISPVLIASLIAAGTDLRWAEVHRKAQIGESRGFAPVDNWHGGMGCGGDERPDTSNRHIAREALRTTSYEPKDPVWYKALIFASRMQNRSERNDQRWDGNVGGFVYSPSMNPPEMGGGTKSYASVTAAGLYSLLLIAVDKSDPLVQAAYQWQTANYTLDINFGTNSKNTLLHFYSAFAKVMTAYGEREFTDSRGQRHDRRNELATSLFSLQEADGSGINHDSNEWWEDKPELATAWSVLALENALN